MKTVKRMRGNVLDPEQYEIHNMPCAQIYRVAAIPNLAANVLTQHIFDTIDYDNDGIYNPALPNQFTIRTTGLYLCHAAATFGSDLTASYRLGYLYKNSGLASIVQYGPFLTGQATNAGNQITCSWQIPFNAGDTLTFWVQTGVVVGLGVANAAGRSNGMAVCLISTI